MTDDYKCYASDTHPDLIQLWKSVQDNTLVPPTTVSEKEYNQAKLLKSPNALKAFIGFGLSFGGRFFAAYAPKYTNGKKENYCQAACNSVRRKREKIKNVDFKCCSYTNLKPSKLLIYCDPPYQQTNHPIKYRIGTKKYDDFDNEEFWKIMRKWSKTNIVIISETTAPDDFIEVWNKESHRSAANSLKTRYKAKNTKKFKTEKLFIHQSIYLNDTHLRFWIYLIIFLIFTRFITPLKI